MKKLFALVWTLFMHSVNPPAEHRIFHNKTNQKKDCYQDKDTDRHRTSKACGCASD